MAISMGVVTLVKFLYRWNKFTSLQELLTWLRCSHLKTQNITIRSFPALTVSCPRCTNEIFNNVKDVPSGWGRRLIKITRRHQSAVIMLEIWHLATECGIVGF